MKSLGLTDDRTRTRNHNAQYKHTMAAAGATTGERIKDRLDADGDGKVSRSEFSALDENSDGRTTKKEAEDIDRDGKAEKKEKDLLDANSGGKITRQEILRAPEADADNNGIVTKQELKHAFHPPPPPSSLARSPPPLPATLSSSPQQQPHHGHSSSGGGSSSSGGGHGGGHHEHGGGSSSGAVASPSAPRPPRTSWRLGLWDTYEDCFTELVLVFVCAVTLHRAVQWLYHRLTMPKRGRQTYKKVKGPGAGLDAYGPDPGVELAMSVEEEEAAAQLPPHAAEAFAVAGTTPDPLDPEEAAGVRGLRSEAAVGETPTPAVVVVSAGISPRGSQERDGHGGFPA